MNWLRVSILTIIIAVLQSSLIGAMRIGGVVPNILLILVVCLAIWGTASEALLSSVLGGFILDISGSGTFGLATSSLVVICLGAVVLRQLGADGHAWPARLGLVAGATVIWAVIHVAAIGLINFNQAVVWWLLITEVLVNCWVSLLFSERWVHGSRKV